MKIQSTLKEFSKKKTELTKDNKKKIKGGIINVDSGTI